jgi:hypothetical protein
VPPRALPRWSAAVCASERRVAVLAGVAPPSDNGSESRGTTDGRRTGLPGSDGPGDRSSDTMRAAAAASASSARV